MGTKNLVMLKSHIDSINLFFANDFVYENLIWALASMWIFFCNYMVHSMGLILTYIFRSQRKNEKFVSLDSSEQNKSNQFEDYEINEFTEELANLIFPSYGNFYRAKEEREVKTEDSVLVKIDSSIQQDDEKRKGETDCYVLKESNFDVNENGNKIELETKGSIFMHSVSDEVHEDVKKIDENETDCSVFIKGDSNFHQDCKKSVKRVHEEEEKTKGSIFIDSTSKSPLVSQKDIGCFEEEPMTLSFSFLRNVSYSNAFSSTQTIVKKQILENNLEEIHVVQDEEKEEYVEEQRKFPSNKNDCLLYNIGSNKNDDSLRYKIIGSNNSCESLKAFEYLEETQFSYDREVSHGFAKCKNEKKETKEDILEKNEKEFDEMDYDENNEEDEFEWENDEIVEQIKLELRKARQGGLATILEDEDEREYSPNVEEIKPLSIEDKKMEYKDHIVEIQKVYKCYAQKIKKLDVLNYQAMHAIGLLQLKDPLKLILEHKSNDPMMKLINELHRDLELVYVGQICLSWEILCWQHEKIQELKKYDSQWPHRYNLVAGKFQLFQVLLQRFLEDEPFQHGDRIQNYVKNPCVIRNLLQVPSIKDDSTTDKKKSKWDEEEPIACERLAQIIKESMQVFWEFIRADKENGNVFHKVSNHKGTKVKDAEISNLLVEVQTQLHKKEGKLKEKLRSRNCIVRKFRKHHDNQTQLDHEQLLTQVGLKLISRVTYMKKVRKDHLIWCSEKLNRIKFVDKKIQVEPSFLFFPC